MQATDKYGTIMQAMDKYGTIMQATEVWYNFTTDMDNFPVFPNRPLICILLLHFIV